MAVVEKQLLNYHLSQKEKQVLCVRHVFLKVEMIQMAVVTGRKQNTKVIGSVADVVRRLPSCHLSRVTQATSCASIASKQAERNSRKTKCMV